MNEAFPVMRVGSPEDLLAAIPFLLGFHPADSLVIVPASNTLPVMRSDLPVSAEATGMVDEYLRTAARQDRPFEPTCFIVGYRTADQVTPTVTAIVSALEGRGWTVHEALRVEGERFWSYVCDDPACCPPEGRPFDNQTHANTVVGVAAGLAPLPTRQAVCDLLAPRHEPGMALAAEDATRWLSTTLSDAAARDIEITTTELAAHAESITLRGLDHYRQGQRLSDQDAAQLAILMASRPVRDRIWAAIAAGPELRTWLALWCDLTRRLPTELVPPCAALAGFCAWLSGDGVLANAACERSLKIDADYAMADLVQQLVAAHVDPATWEEVRQSGRLDAL